MALGCVRLMDQGDGMAVIQGHDVAALQQVIDNLDAFQAKVSGSRDDRV